MKMENQSGIDMRFQRFRGRHTKTASRNILVASDPEFQFMALVPPLWGNTVGPIHAKSGGALRISSIRWQLSLFHTEPGSDPRRDSPTVVTKEKETPQQC